MKSKQSVIDLVNISHKKGIRHVVFSSGSRNATIVIAFNEHGGFQTYSIHDERSAAFFALGIAQQTRETVAIACTSGSAVLNYAPAIAEAYYQKIPLLVITADRPLEWIDQGEGQTMKQHKIYQNFIKDSFEIFQETDHPDELWFNSRMFNEAINLTQMAPKGPVHINLPLREPLYFTDIDFKSSTPKIIEQMEPQPKLSDKTLDDLSKTWNSSKKKLIITGILNQDAELKLALEHLADDESVVVFTETTSNIYSEKFINNIDRFIMSIGKDEEEQFMPEILMTLGSNIVSKKVKKLLRKWKPTEHWDVNESSKVIDTYKSLTKNIKSDIKSFITELNNRKIAQKSTFKSNFFEREDKVKSKHLKFIENTEWCDLKAYSIIYQQLPQNINLQMANSTAVRYAQLMQPRKDIHFNANRGVAGIDGCTSTAVGAGVVNGKLTVLLTGDVAFLYDSNALWNKYLPTSIRIIVFNNFGGNIFRFIPGPSKTKQLEEFFEAHHSTKAENISKAFDVNYYSANNANDLRKVLNQFFENQNNNRPALLELFTPREKNMEILKNYFNNLL